MELWSIGDSGRTITIYFASGDGYCVKPAGIRVEQTATSVMITVLSTSRHDVSACPAMLTVGRSVITLSATLGGRALLHPQVDAMWADSLNSE